MNRIEKCFNKLKTQQKTGLIPFITAGDPEPTATIELMQAMVRGGADLIELGIPFSDPMADGPVIQRSSERALKKGMTLTKTLEIVQHFRKIDNTTPVVLMGYLNPIEAMGYDEFFTAAKQTGVDGVLIVDLPFEEAQHFSALATKNQIQQIFLIAPNTDDERLLKIAKLADGFLYYISLKGVTGSHELDTKSVQKNIKRINDIIDLPIGIGFGIKDAATAASLSAHTDAIIIGSAIVEQIAQYDTASNKLNTQIELFLSSLCTAMIKK